MKTGMAIIMLVISGTADARMSVTEKKECEQYYDQQIERINNRLKQPYREPTGNNLRNERRKYKEERSKRCR